MSKVLYTAFEWKGEIVDFAHEHLLGRYTAKVAESKDMLISYLIMAHKDTRGREIARHDFQRLGYCNVEIECISGDIYSIKYHITPVHFVGFWPHE